MGIHIRESPRAGPSPQHQLAEDQLPRSLSPRLSRAFRESILQGFFWAVCFSLAPWTAPVRCLDHNSVYVVLSTCQWCFYKMLDKWFQCAFWKLMCKAVMQSALSSIVCFPELSVNCVTLTTKGWQCCPVSCSSHTRLESSRLTSLGWATGLKAAIQTLPWKQLRDMTLVCTVGLETS